MIPSSSSTRLRLQWGMLCAVLSGLSFSVAGAAHAGGTTTRCQSQPGCDALLHKGLEAFKKESFQVALTNFEKAYALEADPLLLLNIGRTHYRLGGYELALSYFEKFRSTDPNPGAEIQAKLTRYIRDAQLAQAQQSPSAEAPTLAPHTLQTPLVPDLPDLPAQSSQPVITDGTPVYKKWWLWTGIGVAVAGGLAVGLGVGLSRPQDSLPHLEAVWR